MDIGEASRFHLPSSSPPSVSGEDPLVERASLAAMLKPRLFAARWATVVEVRQQTVKGQLRLRPLSSYLTCAIALSHTLSWSLTE